MSYLMLHSISHTRCDGVCGILKSCSCGLWQVQHYDSSYESSPNTNGYEKANGAIRVVFVKFDDGIDGKTMTESKICVEVFWRSE